MKNLNRLTAAVLAIIMLISCFAVGVFADEEPGHTVSVKFELCHLVDGSWVPGTKFNKGEDVKLRAYLGTDFTAVSADMTIFYENAFFEDSYANIGGMTFNPLNSATASIDATDFGSSFSKEKKNLDKKDLVKLGIIDAAYYDTHNFFQVSIVPKDSTISFDFSTWLFEFDLKVKADADTRGSAYIIPESVFTSTSGSSKGLAVSKYRAATGRGVAANNWSTAFDCEPVYSNTPVSATRDGAATGISIDGDEEISLAKGKTANLSVVISPEGAENKAVTWSSSDENVATVDSGVITGVGKGTAVITATTQDGGFTDSVEVSVFVPATEINVPAYNPSVEKGKTASIFGGSLPVTLVPEDAYVGDLEFSSSNENVATIDENGVVTGVSAGQTNITVKSKTNPAVEESFPFNVVIPATDVSFYVPEISIEPGEIISLEPEVEPADSTDKLTYKSSDASVATVSKTGTVTAVGKGTAVITVTTESGKTATITVKVEKPAKSIYVDGAADAGAPNNHYVNDSFKLNVLTDPADADDVSLIYSSDKPTVASVDENGNVQVKTGGTAEITVKTADDKLSTTYVIKAIYGVTGVALNTHEATIDRGDSLTLTATVKPSVADNKTVIWSSSNPSVASVTDGAVKGLGKGTATITATTEDGSFTDTCVVNVTVNVKNVTVESALTELKYGEEEYIEVSVSPADADNLAVTCSSSDPAVVDVSVDEPVVSGTGKLKIKAKSGGTAVITVTVGGKETRFTVNVKRNAEAVTPVGSTDVSVAPGESKELSVTLSPADTTEKNLTWTSSNPSVATVDENGKVTAVGEGQAKITVTAPGGKAIEFTVTVKNPNPCANVRISAPSGKTIGWKSRPRIVASASGLPEEYKGQYFLQLYEGNSPVGEKSAEMKLDITRGSLKNDTDYSVRVVDSRGNIQKDASGNDLKKDFTVKVAKKFFFDKIIAFFKYIFSLFSSPFGFKRPIEKI